MALIKCTECGHEVSDKASACPNCGCPLEKESICNECGQLVPDGVDACPNCGCPIERVKTANQEVVYETRKNIAWIWSLIIALLCLIGGGGFYAYTKLYNKTIVDNMQRGEVNSNSEEDKAGNGNSNTDEGEYVAGVLKKGSWAYSNPTDPMTDEPTYGALCMSNESLEICGQRTHLQLYLMHLPSGSNSVFVQIADGVLRQDKLPMIYFRFDGGGVDTIAVMANGAKAHLIPNEKKANDIINNLRKSKKCAIKVEAQDGGTATYTFNTEGLEWDY